MIDAGVEVLIRDGIGLGASTFRYRDAFAALADDDIKVTRGSVHERIWSSQLAWQLDVLSEVINRNDTERRMAVGVAIADSLETLPIDTIDQRRLVMAEAARIGGLAFVDNVVSEPHFRMLPTLVAAWKASGSDLPEYERLGEILRTLQRQASERFRRELIVLIDHLDLRPHPSRGLDLAETVRAYCAISIALSFATAIRLGDDPHLTEHLLARCPDGVERSWNLLGLANWMVANQLLVDRELVDEPQHREEPA